MVPTFRGQGNALFKTDELKRTYARGQVVPYEVNGAPPLPPEPPGALALNINGLPSADPAEPLYEIEIPEGGFTFTGVDFISAGVAATASTVLRYFKNGAANGTLTFTGSAGTSNFSDSTYAEGDLFGLYPPLTADATLDRLRITLGTD